MENEFDNDYLGWGIESEGGEEIWDDRPLFADEKISKKDWFKLCFYPKKFVLYHWVNKAYKKRIKDFASDKEGTHRRVRILDIGCGTGATIVDFKRMFGKNAEVIGLDVVQLQVDIAKQRIKEYGVWAEVYWYDGKTLPFSEETVDIIYTSDVLGHVADVPSWTRELSRVLRPGGTLAMFAESKIGKHAYLRRYLQSKGINIDPHAKYHISLYSKEEIKHLLVRAGFKVKKIMTVFWAKALAHPDEFDAVLRKQKKFFLLKNIFRGLTALKKATKPYSLAIAEFYGLVEMETIGRFLEAQGYVILAEKPAVGVFEEEKEIKKDISEMIPELGAE